MSKEVFLSFTEDDSTYAFVLKYLIESYGLEAYEYHSENTGGNSVSEDVIRAIEGCTYFLAILSNKSMKSGYQYAEIKHAKKCVDAGMPIRMLMIMKEEVSNTMKVDAILGDTNYVELHDLEKLRRQMYKFIKALGVLKKWNTTADVNAFIPQLRPKEDRLKIDESLLKANTRVLALSSTNEGQETMEKLLSAEGYGTVESVIAAPLRYRSDWAAYDLVLFNALEGGSDFEDAAMHAYMEEAPGEQLFHYYKTDRYALTGSYDSRFAFSNKRNKLAPNLLDQLREQQS